MEYALTVVVNSKAHVSKFVSGISKDMVKGCRTPMFVKEIYTSRLIFLSQQIEKVKEKEIENMKDKIGSFNFSKERSDGGNRYQFYQKSSTPFLSSASSPVPKFNRDHRDR